MSRIIPVIMVSKSLLERLEKARAGLVQRRTWVNNSPSAKGHYRMQWVALGPSAGKEKDYSKQRDLFGEPRRKAAEAVFGDQDFSEKDRRHAEEIEAANRYNESPEGKADAKRQRFELLAEKIAKDHPDKPVEQKNQDVYSKAKTFLADKGFIHLGPERSLSNKIYSLAESLRQSGMLTPTDEKAMAVEFLTSGIKGIDRFARLNGRMPRDDRDRKKKYKKLLTEIKSGGDVPIDIMKEAVHDAARDFAGIKDRFDEDENESNKRLAIMLSKVISRHLEKEEKPAPKAGLEDVRKMSDDALDAEHLKLFPKFNEVQKLKGYRYQEDHEKVMPYSDYQRMRDVMNEMLRRSEIERENLKEYPGLTKDETWFIISTKKMIDKMKKQNGGEISPEKLKDMSHMINWMRKLESKIKEPEKTVEKPNAAEKPESGDDSKDRDLTIGEQYSRKGAVNAKADGMWVVYFDKDGKQMGTKKIGSAGEARDEAEMFNRDYAGEKPAASTENKAYPGLTNKEIMELITSRNTLGLMEKQYKGSVAPRVKKEMSALQDRIREIESKIKEPEKPSENKKSPQGRKDFPYALVSKAGYGNGWEYVKEENADRVVMGSARHGAVATVTGNYDAGYEVTFSGEKAPKNFNAKNLEELGSKLRSAFDEATAKTENKEGKKPFEDMTFKERNKPGLPENVAETVRDVLGVSSGTAANYAGSNKYDDIDKFKYAAAKWAYENDKVGSASDILDQYARHKGIRKSILDTFRDGLAKAFGGR